MTYTGKFASIKWCGAKVEAPIISWTNNSPGRKEMDSMDSKKACDTECGMDVLAVRDLESKLDYLTRRSDMAYDRIRDVSMFVDKASVLIKFFTTIIAIVAVSAAFVWGVHLLGSLFKENQTLRERVVELEQASGQGKEVRAFPAAPK